MPKYIIILFAIFSGYSLFAQKPDTARKEYLGVLTLTEKYKDEKNWTQADEAIVGAHFQRLVKMKTDGIVVLAGRTQLQTNDPDMMGLVIFYAADDKAALQFMMDDPAVKNNIMLAKVHPYNIALNKCE